MTLEWDAASKCVDKKYDRERTNIGPLSACMNKTAEFDYNKNRGLLRYYDPMARLLCVYFDFAPNIADYFPNVP